ncbi:STAS/SEC14 domain-containing protein [Blastopirellula sp. JC732]|uniref:STAS/SEC14 domain-containing protein n=1 Tax=Blastopirellula sediminis TaxID=2894196 RepID=A0A9X1MPT0_9BACT|nr:STAS/SEC14 domain-containing protein [Blastopirellula sediminis]MCC9607333.1 STAS/SEC14 domain-containing protein [Blastopirellula sediminis]MCC9629374.1 STAS/SEC14 domain-containing protein [Blastopirellula sediminis]
MLDHQLLPTDGIMILEPKVPLEVADFEGLAHEIDPYIAEHGGLHGLMIHAKAFPGWENLDAAFAHMHFIEAHQENISRIAVVSDNLLLEEFPRFVGRLLHPEVKHFPEAKYEDALEWLKSAA